MGSFLQLTWAWAAVCCQLVVVVVRGRGVAPAAAPLPVLVAGPLHEVQHARLGAGEHQVVLVEVGAVVPARGVGKYLNSYLGQLRETT